MTPDIRNKLKNLLTLHEGFRQFPYSDNSGHVTIGIGRNLSNRGISASEALSLLDDDILYFTSKLSHILPFFNDLDGNRQIVLVNMCFNLGINGFLEFSEMLEAVKLKEWERASEEILNSKAATQNMNRYEQLAYIMKTGEL